MIPLYQSSMQRMLTIACPEILPWNEHVADSNRICFSLIPPAYRPKIGFHPLFLNISLTPSAQSHGFLLGGNLYGHPVRWHGTCGEPPWVSSTLRTWTRRPNSSTRVAPPTSSGSSNGAVWGKAGRVDVVTTGGCNWDMGFSSWKVRKSH